MDKQEQLGKIRLRIARTIHELREARRNTTPLDEVDFLLDDVEAIGTNLRNDMDELRKEFDE